ncbi:MAG: PorT family protein [Acidobacteria bacterium]|nr:PorT family protein [Acidobacteriota bacterium]
MARAASAQVFTGGTRLELAAGWNFSNFSGDGSMKHRTGLVAGVGVLHPIGNTGWSFEPQLAYSMKGAESDGAVGETTFKVDYVEVPVLFRYEFWADADSHPFFSLGATPAFQVGCRAHSESGAIALHRACSDDNLDPHGFDVGLTGGGGFAFRYLNHLVTIGGRYNYGLVDVFRRGPNERNSVWSVVSTVDFPWLR